MGRVIHVRVSRSKKSGRARGYAFVEMGDGAAARRVVDALNGYMMFGKVLVANRIKDDKADDMRWDRFGGSEGDMKKISWRRIERERYHQPRDAARIQKLNKRLLSRQVKKLKRWGDGTFIDDGGTM